MENINLPKLNEFMLKTAVFFRVTYDLFGSEMEMLDFVLKVWAEPNSKVLQVVEKIGLNPEQITRESLLYKELLESLRGFLSVLKKNNEEHSSFLKNLSATEAAKDEQLKKLLNF